MDQFFVGFFAVISPDDLEEARGVIAKAIEKWPGCQGDVVYDPFVGLAVASPGSDSTLSSVAQEQFEQSLERAGKIEDELPTWSQQYPDLKFVFIEWEDCGWEIEYRGYICQNGTISEHIDGENALGKLVANLGVLLGPKNYFPPLSPRFYW